MHALPARGRGLRQPAPLLEAFGRFVRREVARRREHKPDRPTPNRVSRSCGMSSAPSSRGGWNRQHAMCLGTRPSSEQSMPRAASVQCHVRSLPLGQPFRRLRR